MMRDLTDFENEALAAGQYYWDWDAGYSKEQSTRPQTVGYGLVDSPAGQAAWIIEKFWAWTDSDGHPENVLTRDELLDNIMMYWLPASAASSARLYWESFSILTQQQPKIVMPAGVSIFPHEIFRASKRWVEERFTDLVHYNVLPKGGHFAAFEQPTSFIDEVRTCFRHMR
jgi:pimeloyl-ACP methyl ester carboxylesterase